MPEAVVLPLLREFLPSGLSYGTIILVEFDAHSPWYEASLTLAAQSLGKGIKTDYHIFQHVPTETRSALASFGVDVARLEKEGTLRIIDSYTVTTGLETSEQTDDNKRLFETRSLSLTAWTKGLITDIKGGIAEERKRRLHIDDNASVIVQYNDEKSFIDFWRTKLLPEVRALEFACLHGIVTDAYSSSFYKQLEAVCDGIIDLRSLEKSGRIEHYARVRMLRGKAPDSRWRVLRLLDTGEVVVEAKRHRAPDLGISGWVKGAEKSK